MKVNERREKKGALYTHAVRKEVVKCWGFVDAMGRDVGYLVATGREVMGFGGRCRCIDG
jgi:hypothetical protein